MVSQQKINQLQNNSLGANLWIGEVENWMDEKYLIQSLQAYNVEAKNVKLIRDKNTGVIMGYGFLEFETYEQANLALNTLNGKLMPNTGNRTFKLNWASYSTNKTSNTNSQNLNESSIYVCELDQSVTEEFLKQFFTENYSSVIGAKIVVDPSTKLSKGYGFVKFSNYEESQKAMCEMNGKIINGKPMKTGQASFKKNSMINNANVKGKNMYNTSNNYGNMGNGVYMYNANPEMYPMANDSNLFMQQQYLNNFFMVNGYYPNYMNPQYFQMYAGYLQQQMGDNQPQGQQQQLPTDQTNNSNNTGKIN